MNETGSSSESSKPNNSKSDRIVLSDGRIITSGKLKSGTQDPKAAQERAARNAARAEREAQKAARKAAKAERAQKAREAKENEKARMAAKKARLDEELKAKDEERARRKEAKKAAREEKARKAAEAKEAEKARMAAKKAKLEEEQKAKDEERARKKEEKKAARKRKNGRSVPPEEEAAPEDSTEKYREEVPQEYIEEAAEEAAEQPAAEEEAAAEETPSAPRRPHTPGAIVLQDGRELKSGKLKSSRKSSRRKKNDYDPLSDEPRKKRRRRLNPTAVAIRIAMVLIAVIIVFVIASRFANSTSAEADSSGEISDESGTGMESESETEAPLRLIERSTDSIRGQLQTTEVVTEEIDEYADTKTPAWAKGRWVPFSMVFTGDVYPGEILNAYTEKGIYGIIDRDLRAEMKTAALTMINQEFAFGTGGIKREDKQNTFRVDTQYAPIYDQLGVRLVSLANDHVLDFGKDLLAQNFRNLEDIHVDYVGAGANPERAAQWQSYQLGKVKVAVLAASRVLPTSDWNVENSTPGVFSTYDPARLMEQIAAAKEENDLVIVYVHWGIEKSSGIESYQQELAHNYVEAGADLIIGSHPHVLQGIEYYKDTPIIYSLGSFMYHENNSAAAMLKVNVNRFKRMQLQLIPCVTTDSQTHTVSDEEAYLILQQVEKLSENAQISRAGIISKK